MKGLEALNELECNSFHLLGRSLGKKRYIECIEIIEKELKDYYQIKENKDYGKQK